LSVHLDISLLHGILDGELLTESLKKQYASYVLETYELKVENLELPQLKCSPPKYYQRVIAYYSDFVFGYLKNWSECSFFARH
jgi:hypothetical protein